MKEHAKLDRDMFAVRWVTLGLRVDVNCALKGLMMSMVPLASFTIGGNSVINADTLKTIAPSVDCSEVQARFNDLQPRGILARGSFNRENEQWCCEWLDDLQHKQRLLHDFPCFYALQETDNWTISAMDVPGHIVYGREAILCPRQVCQFRRSWVSHERCTAILVGAMMILSVYLPHSGFDEEDYFATLEAVRDIMGEGKKLGAVDFFIGGDINIELKLEPGDEDLQGLDGIDWYGIYGPECLGGGGDVITYEKKLRWLQLLRDFDCTVTTTLVDAENLGECHTWRAWGSRIRKKNVDYIMGLRDLVSTTWFLNKTRIRTWDHFPVLVKIEGREMRVKKAKTGSAGWTPVSEDEEQKFKELCLCPD